ncbi:unnamed protein product [Dicrocoelium dendriticum]|nr:unnamed protein product [Dicrocoelium dendriticum]
MNLPKAAKEAATKKILESQLLTVAQALEDTVDEQLTRLDHLSEDDLDAIRQRRLQQLKEESKQRSEWLAAGHGVYSELPNERDFFDACKRSAFGLVCHFYRDSTFRCKIVDKHLELLAPKHIECRMIKLNAEKSPFLTQRLNIIVIPTIVLVKDAQVCDRIVGFDELGGHDEFSTAMLEWRLAVGRVINYAGDLTTPPDAVKSSSNKLFGLDSRHRETKNIRSKTIGGVESGDESDNDDD